MTCVRSIKFVIPGGPGAPDVEVYVEEQNGALVFTVTVLSTPTLTADLRGLFFDVADASQLTGMAVSQVGAAVTDFDTGNVIDLGNGANMIGAADPFDVGLEFGTQGIGKDDIQTATFTLTNADGDLTLDDLAHVEFGARLTSIGAPGGSRTDSAKLTTIAPAAPDAVDDNYPNLFEDGAAGLDDPSKTPQGILLQVLANDTDADGDTLTITGFDPDHLPQHGTVEIVDGDDADLLIGDAILYTPDLDYAGDDAFVYCITDNNGGTDFAEVTLTLAAVADVPLLSYEIIAGDSVTEIILRVTATQNDADASEFIDRILLSVPGGLPAGSIVPGSVNPAGTPGSITQDFLITVPFDQDVDYTLDITAWSEEFSNGDQESATTSVQIETNYTQTLLEATFTATDQSIWDSGDQFVFEDDRFFGIDTSWNEDGSGTFNFDTDGYLKAGFQSTLTFEGGEIDAEVVYDLDVETLYNKTTDVLFLTADAVLDDASFSTEGPEGTYTLDFIFQFLLNAELDLDLGILGSWDIFDLTLGPVDESFNILDLDSDNLGFTLPLPAGFSIDFAWPNLDTTSDPLVGNTATSSGASNNFLELGLDVDSFLFTLLGLPNPFEIEWDLGIVWATIELLDLDLSLGLNFLQDFAMTVNSLEGTITFEDGSSQSFDFDTDITVANASSLDVNNDGIIGYELELAPDVDLLNDTELGFNFGVQFDVLKLSGGYNIGVDSGSFSLGPVFDAGTTVPLGSIDVYENTFDLAFGSQDYVFTA